MSNFDHVAVVVNDQAGSTTAQFAGVHVVTASGADAAGAATKYLAYVGGNHAAAQVSLHVVTRAGVVRNLRVNLATASGGTDTYAVTVQQSSNNCSSYSDTTLTATCTGTAKSAADTSHTPSVALGDVLAVKVVSSAGTAAAATVSFEVG